MVTIKELIIQHALGAMGQWEVSDHLVCICCNAKKGEDREAIYKAVLTLLAEFPLYHMIDNVRRAFVNNNFFPSEQRNKVQLRYLSYKITHV